MRDLSLVEGLVVYFVLWFVIDKVIEVYNEFKRDRSDRSDAHQTKERKNG